MQQTLTEKILSRALGQTVRAGEIVSPEPELIVVHDWYAANVGRTLDRFGIRALHAPEKVMFVTDHEPVAVTPEAAARQKFVRELASRFHVARFFDVGRGGHGHVFPVEMGMVRPGTYVAAYDTHVPNYGAVGALGIAFLTEIVDILTFGSVWMRVPHTVRINVSGRLPKWVSIRDFAQKLIADLDPDVVDYSVVEFGGSGIAGLPFDARFTLCNTPIEIGAKSALVEPDGETQSYMLQRGVHDYDMLSSDPDAPFAQVHEYVLDDLEPQIAVPPVPDNVVAISQLIGTPVQHAFIGSCASGMLSDLQAAATVLSGRKVDPRVRLFITPATYEVMAKAAAEGLIETFARAGAILTAPGCGPCAAGRVAPLAPGEASINTGTRNDSGRLGPADARIYIGAPITVACSAVAGHIVDPREMMAESK
jgi:3-isopropylmalate/(R)-2-methylmalate dehydratase large subunit